MPPFNFYTDAMNPAYNWLENWALPLIAGASLNVSLPNVTGVTGGAYINTPSISFKDRVSNYFNKYSSDKYNLANSAISAGANLAGNLINSNGLSSTAGNIMSGVGNIVGNIPGPIGWAGKGLAFAGLIANALWGHKFNDANVAAAESANRERSNWQFGDYSNTDALLAGSMANVLLGNVSKGFLGKEGPFSNAVTNKMNLINNDRILANLRANNSELNAYNNYLTGMVRNAIAGDSMGNVNAAASGGPLNMISGTMTPFGNRYFANGGFTHGGMFTNGFVKVNNGGSHELNPNQGVQYGVDPQGTPNMVEEGETIFNDYVFSDRIKFPKRYKDEFALGGKIWKKSFADVSKMIAKESEERPNDPISQRSLKAMGGKLADIQEEVKAKQALDKMDPREVMAMLQLMSMMLQLNGQPQMQEQQMMQDPYQQMGMEQAPIMQACGGKINRFDGGGRTRIHEPYYKHIKNLFTINGVTYAQIPAKYTNSGRAVDAESGKELKGGWRYVRLGKDGKWYTTTESQDMANIQAHRTGLNYELSAFSNGNGEAINAYDPTNPLYQSIVNSQFRQGEDYKELEDKRVSNYIRQILPTNEEWTNFLVNAGLLGTGIEAAWAAPGAFATSMAGMMAGSTLTDAAVSGLTDYDSWSDMAQQKWGFTPLMGDLSNPGAWIGGGIGNRVYKGYVTGEGLPAKSEYAQMIEDTNPYPSALELYRMENGSYRQPILEGYNPTYIPVGPGTYDPDSITPAYQRAESSSSVSSTTSTPHSPNSNRTNRNSRYVVNPDTGLLVEGDDGLYILLSDFNQRLRDAGITPTSDMDVNARNYIDYLMNNSRADLEAIVNRSMAANANTAPRSSVDSNNFVIDPTTGEILRNEYGDAMTPRMLNSYLRQRGLRVTSDVNSNILIYRNHLAAINPVMSNAPSGGGAPTRTYSWDTMGFLARNPQTGEVLVDPNTGRSVHIPNVRLWLEQNGSFTGDYAQDIQTYMDALSGGAANTTPQTRAQLPMDKIITPQEADNFIAQGYTKNDLAKAGLLISTDKDTTWYGRDWLNNLAKNESLPEALGLARSTEKNLRQLVKTGMEGTDFWYAGPSEAVDMSTFWIDPQMMMKFQNIDNINFPSGAVVPIEGAGHTSAASDVLHTRSLLNVAQKYPNKAVFGDLETLGVLNPLGDPSTKANVSGNFVRDAWKAAGADFDAYRSRIAAEADRQLEAFKATYPNSTTEQLRKYYGNTFNRLFKTGTRPRIVVEGDPDVEITWDRYVTDSNGNPILSEDGLPIEIKNPGDMRDASRNNRAYARVLDERGNLVPADKFRHQLGNYSDIVDANNAKIDRKLNQVMRPDAAGNATRPLPQGFDPRIGRLEYIDSGTASRSNTYFRPGIYHRKPKYVAFGQYAIPIGIGLGASTLGINPLQDALQLLNSNGYTYKYGGNLNLFKNGGKPRKSKYKSDNDWEKMYELSKPIYQQFIDAGIDPMIAVGVLGNIALESSFNHKASNKTHWGYVLNDRGLTNYVTSNYGGYGPQHQIQYLIDGLTKGIKGSDKGKGKAIQKRFTNFLNASKGLTDPADVAAMWDKYYEISGGLAMYDRRNYATKFWNKYNIPQTAQEALEVQLPLITEPYQPQQQQIPYAPIEQPQSYLSNSYLSPYSNYISYMQPYTDNMQSYLGNPNLNLQFANGGFVNRFDIGGGFSRELPDDIQKAFKNTDWGNKKSVMNLLYLMTKDNIIDHRYAGILADSVLTGRFDDMFKNEMRTKGLKSSDILSNILSGSVNGIARSIKEKDKKTGKEVEKEVIDEWLGPQAYDNLVGNAGYSNYDYNLNRGLMNGLEDLTYKFNPTTSSRLDVLDYLFNYATTDTQKQASYRNARTKELEDAARKEWDDWKYGESTIPEGMIVPDNNNFPTYKGLRYSDIKGLDPNSKEFAALNEAELNLARTAYLRDKFANDKEYIKYAEKFLKEADDAEALRRKDEELQKALHSNALPTWMRYAPLAFSSVATLTDALGLTNKPDLTPYNQLIGLSDRLNRTPSVRSHPVFLPMIYKPGNLNYLLGAADNIFASTLRAMNDTSGGNIGAANAGNVIAMNNAMANRAKIHESLANQNMQDMKTVLDYNNKGAFQDATASLEAQKINSANLLNAQRFGYQALSDALRYYQTEQQAANAAKQVNLTHAVNSWANLGRENMYMNMINSNKAWDYMMNPNGTSVYKYLTDMFG